MVTDVATAAIKGSFKIWSGFKKPSSSVVLSSVAICMFAIYIFSSPFDSVSLHSLFLSVHSFVYICVSHLSLVYLILCMLYLVLQDVIIYFTFCS